MISAVVRFNCENLVLTGQYLRRSEPARLTIGSVDPYCASIFVPT